MKYILLHKIVLKDNRYNSIFPLAVFENIDDARRKFLKLFDGKTGHTDMEGRDNLYLYHLTDFLGTEGDPRNPVRQNSYEVHGILDIH